MVKAEKINFIKDNHMKEWLQQRKNVEDNLSAKQSIFCVCGRLATGFHEMNCKKFKNKIDSETLKSLKHLIKS